MFVVFVFVFVLPEQVWVIWTVLHCMRLMSGVLADRTSGELILKLENIYKFHKYIFVEKGLLVNVESRTDHSPFLVF